MSEHGRDTLLDCLFVGQESSVTNVKFFRGDDEFITPADLKAEFAKSVERCRVARKDGVKSTMPKCRNKTIDLRKLVADMA